MPLNCTAVLIGFKIRLIAPFQIREWLYGSCLMRHQRDFGREKCESDAKSRVKLFIELVSSSDISIENIHWRFTELDLR